MNKDVQHPSLTTLWTRDLEPTCEVPFPPFDELHLRTALKLVVYGASEARSSKNWRPFERLCPEDPSAKVRTVQYAHQEAYGTSHKSCHCIINFVRFDHPIYQSSKWPRTLSSQSCGFSFFGLLPGLLLAFALESGKLLGSGFA